MPTSFHLLVFLFSPSNSNFPHKTYLILPLSFYSLPLPLVLCLFPPSSFVLFPLSATISFYTSCLPFTVFSHWSFTFSLHIFSFFSLSLPHSDRSLRIISSSLRAFPFYPYFPHLHHPLSNFVSPFPSPLTLTLPIALCLPSAPTHIQFSFSLHYLSLLNGLTSPCHPRFSFFLFPFLSPPFSPPFL